MSDQTTMLQEPQTMEAPIPPDEPERLSALKALNILDTAPEERFDRITRIAARLFNVPIALVSLVDENRQWFKSCVGLSSSETPRAISFCAYAVLGHQPLVIPDAMLDERFKDSPLVKGNEGIRFYAGYPLKTADGSRVGTLCIKDRCPRQMNEEDLNLLRDLAAVAESELNLAKGVKQAELENDRLASIPRENPNPVLESNPEGEITYSNPAAQRILSELDISDVSGILPADHISILTKASGNGRSVSEAEAYVEDRVYAWSYHKVPSTGNIHLYARDVTQKRQAEQELRESKNQLKGMLEHLPDGVSLLNNEKRLILNNPLADEYLPLLGNIQVGDVVTQIGDTTLEELLDGQEKILAKEITLDVKPKKIFEVSLCSIPWKDEEEGWVLVTRDVTEDRETQERSQQQDRLAAVGQLAAGIAHDFNNLLTVIIGLAQMQQMDPDLPENTKEQMETIASQGQRAAQLVQQVLDFSRKSVVEKKSIDLVPFLKESVKLMERTLPESIRIVSDFDSGGFPVLMDLTQMQQVITNLAVNASHAMRDGGELTFGLSQIQVGPTERPPVPGMEHGVWIALGVADTGTGMPDEVVEHIFEPFFTTKKPGEGTGLGLAQVYGIVKQHGGEIKVNSDLGEGTTFTLYFPKSAEGKDLTLAQEVDIPRGAGETILVVEDRPEVLEVAKEMLEQLNYGVVTAENGKDALAIYKSDLDKISAVLTDMVMPEMGGLELIQALKKINPEIKTVVMTGYPLGEKGMDELPLKLSGTLKKPLNMEQLSRVFGKALSQAHEAEAM